MGSGPEHQAEFLQQHHKLRIMKNDDYQSTFSRAVLTGVFVGFVSTLVCLFYNVLYRNSTGFLPADIINVSSLIFAVNLLFLVIGVIYYFFLKIGRAHV